MILPEDGPRLRFRPVEHGDLPFLAEMLSDPEVMRHYPKPLDRAEAARWIDRIHARYAADGMGLWLVVRREDGAPVGQIGLLRQDVEGASLVEIAYLLHRPYWGMGYATEAALQMRALAFDRHGVDVLHALIRPANTPSQAVARRVGMDVLREVMFHGMPHLLFGMGRPDGGAGR